MHSDLLPSFRHDFDILNMVVFLGNTTHL